MNYRNYICHFVNILFSLATVPAFFLPIEQTVWASESAVVHVNSPPKTGQLKTIHSKTTHNLPFALATDTHTWQAYRLPHPHRFTFSSLTSLPVLANGQSALPSNANNFHGAWNTSVNPRTGNATFTVTLASFLYDQSQGKQNLTLSYSGGVSAFGFNPLNIGSHWSFNVGTEHPSTSEIAGHETTDITTGDGHSFTMESMRNKDGKTIWHPLRHKLGDVIITGQPGNWTVAMASGIREHLLNGYEDWEESRDGQRIWFYYDHNGTQDMNRHLIYICAHPLTNTQLHSVNNACSDNGVWLTYQSKDITIHGQQQLVLHLFTSGGMTSVKSISMPSLSSSGVSNSSQPAEIHFDYDTQGNRPWLLHSVTEPYGEKTTLLYNQESSHLSRQFHGLRTGINHAFLPVVTEQIITPPKRSEQAVPIQHIWYQYTGSTTDQHNYTGYLAGVNMEPGKDNLLDRRSSYTYQVSVDNGITLTTTTYNKFHLPLKATEQSSKQHTLLIRSEKQYLPWKNTRFSELMPEYSLPQASMETLYALDEEQQDPTITPEKVIQQKRYNDNGQVIWQKDVYSRQTFTWYCPSKGDSHCPAINPEWPEATLPEKVIQVPAQQIPSDDSSPVVETIYDYTRTPIASVYRQLGATKTAGFLQVKTKTVGTLPVAQIADLKPGDPLPALAIKQITTQTHYQYNHQQESPEYGQLKKLTVTKFADATPEVNGKSLKISALKTLISPVGQIIVDISRQTDLKKNTRTVTMTSPNSDAIKAMASVDAGDNANTRFSMGTKSYSLSSGVTLSEEDPLKTQRTTWHYDLWHRPIKEVITPASGGDPQTLFWHYIVTPKETSVVETDSQGRQTKTVFVDNKVLSTWHRAASQTKAPMEGLTNWIPDAQTTYTTTDKPASVTVWHAADPQGEKPGKPIALTTTYGYDALDRQVWEKSPDGMVYITARDDPDRRGISYELSSGNLPFTPSGSAIHSVLGPVMKVVDSNVLGEPVAQYIFPLDPAVTRFGKPLYSATLQSQLQNLRKQLQPVSSLQPSGSHGLLPLKGKNGMFAFIRAAIAARAWYTRTMTTYDGNGRKIQQTSGNGAVTRWKWQAGNLVATITPDGRVINDTFDLQGLNLARCVQPAGGSVCHVLGTRKYDSQGNLLWQADEYGHKLIYHHDRDGRLLSLRTPPTSDAPQGHIFTYQYNSIGKTLEKVDGVTYVKYTYNPATWQLSDREDQISHLHYDYDATTGLLVKITRSSPKTIKPLTAQKIHYPEGHLAMAYDRYGELTAETDFAGDHYTTTHDILGREISTFVTLPGSTLVHKLTTTTYDNFGRPQIITSGVGLTESLTYNNMSQLSSVTASGNGFFQRLQYTYDPDTDNINTLTRRENQDSATQTYKYDKLNNLTDMHCSVTGKPNIVSDLCPRDTDTEGSHQLIPPVIFSQHYLFDNWNNIKTVTEQLVTQKNTHIGKTVTYTYAGNHAESSLYDPHRLTAITTRWQDQNYSASPKTLLYDELGRIIRDADGNRLHYNAFGQLDNFSRAKTGEHTLYVYDSFGHQVAEQPFSNKNTPLQAPLYMLYQGNRIVMQVQEDKQHQQHTSVELGNVAHSEDGLINRWYLHDYKGDVLDTFSNTGHWLTDKIYSPYGMQYDRLSQGDQSLPSRLFLQHQKNWWQNHQPAFDNQMSDPSTGYLFLGGGYRGYNPVYRHFMVKDSFSPFMQIDGYGFAANNPVMNSDPDGHSPRWVAYMMGGLGILMNVATAMVFPIAMVFASFDTPLIAAGITAAAAMGVSGGASGALQVGAIAHPQNKSLSVAGTSLDIISNFSMIGIGAVDIAGGLMSASALTGSMLVTSGIAGSASGASGSMASGMNLTENSGIAPASTILNEVSQLFMAGSIAAAGLSAVVPEGASDTFFSDMKNLLTGKRGNCFTKETLVTLASKKQVPISEIHLGDMVLTSPQNSGLEKNSINTAQQPTTVSISPTSIMPWYIIELSYDKTFSYNSQKQKSLPINCTLTCQRSDADNMISPRLLHCREKIRLLRSTLWTKQQLWQQKKQGYVDFDLPELGIHHVRAHMVIISSIQLPLEVLTNTTSQPATGIFIRHTNDVKTYKFKNQLTGQIGQVNATPEHPFYVANLQRYIPISRLSPAYQLVSANGDPVSVICPPNKYSHCGKPYRRGQVTTVYNLEINKRHRYFVGSQGIEVHNAYKCRKCGKEFSSSYRLKVHRQNSHGRSNICPDCGVIFSTKHNLSQHMKLYKTPEEHPRVETNYACTFEGCDQQFRLKRQLTRHTNENHMRTKFSVNQDGMPSYMCQCCHKQFRRIWELSFHQKTMHSIATPEIFNAPSEVKVHEADSTQSVIADITQESKD